MNIDIARLVRVPVSDAAVRRIIKSIPPLRVRGGEGELRSHRNPSQPPLTPRGGASAQSLSIAFVGPAAMRRLNRTYHGEDRVTDVLSFGSRAAEQQSSRAKRKRGPAALLPIRPAAASDLGELVVCPDRVKRQAKQAGEPFRRELTRVLIHGTLHLLGEDHATPRQAERMFSFQELLVTRLTARCDGQHGAE